MAISRSQPTEVTQHIKFHIFDIIGMSRPSEERYLALTQLGRGIRGNAELVPHYTKTCINTLAHMMQAAVAADYEGLMLKPVNGRYTAGRSRSILKWKSFKEMLGKVIEFSEGEGKFKGTLGSLRLKAPTGVEFMCGTGWTDLEREHIWKHKDLFNGKTCVVKFLNLSAEGRPKLGTFIRWEADPV
jgi:DNA ligase-1